MTSRRGAFAALTTAVLVAVAGAAPALAAGTTRAAGTAATAAGQSAGQASRHLVAVDPAADPAAGSRIADVLRSGDGRLLAVHESVGTVVVEVTPDVAARLARLAGVRSVTPDGVAHLQSLGYSPASQAGSMTNINRLTGAQSAWRRGITGAGVDVAVIDTGTTPVTSLRSSSKVVVGPDLSFDSQALNLRYLDGYGHGTHMASIIAGREVAPAAGTAYAADTRNLYGMAPDARIVSVKVGDHNGAVDVSQLIAAVDWVVQNRRTGGLNVRVLNLSFGTNSAQSYVVDPLSYAAEVAWNNGIFVVASAGNDGSKVAGLANPAFNKNLFAVGAVDTRGTDTMADDVVPEFSQHPYSTRYQREPDVVAPGVGIVAAGVPGSVLWSRYSSARVGIEQFRGSGTSQSAAVVSGAAALLFQRWPNATPDTMKELLTRTATPLRHTTAAIQGRGELNVAAAMASAPVDPRELGEPTVAGSRGVVNHPFSKSTGTGSLELARGSHHVVMDGVVLFGERDIMGASWSGALTALLTRELRMWTGNGSFNGNQWIGEGFTPDTTTVAGRAWGGRSWAGRSWAGRSWAGSLWSGRSWASRVWNGRSWAGQTWSAASWSSNATYGAERDTSTSVRTGPTVSGPAAVPRHWSTASWR
jgi:serine protease AprX